MRYRAFVFVVAAPQQFVAGNALDGMPGSRFCWYGFVCMQQRQLKKFLRPFEGVPCGVRPISQANKQGKQTSGGRIILSDEAKGVSL